MNTPANSYVTPEHLNSCVRHTFCVVIQDADFALNRFYDFNCRNFLIAVIIFISKYPIIKMSHEDGTALAMVLILPLKQKGQMVLVGVTGN